MDGVTTSDDVAMPVGSDVSVGSAANDGRPRRRRRFSSNPLPAGDVSVKYSVTVSACSSVRETLAPLSGSKPSATIWPCSIVYSSPSAGTCR